jgi:uncharacterized protein (TIGR03086 family)
MTAASDPVATLARALDQAGAVVAAVRPEQATLPTPCRAWDVRTLVNHLVQDVRQFAVTAQGGRFQADDADVIGDDWAGAYRQAADALLAVWRRPGVLERTVRLPIGEFTGSWRVGQQVADVAVHAWDVARATGQPTELDPEVGQAALDWARRNLQPRFRGEEGQAAFGAEVAVPADAPLYDRLAAFFGRDPAERSGPP